MAISEKVRTQRRGLKLKVEQSMHESTSSGPGTSVSNDCSAMLEPKAGPKSFMSLLCSLRAGVKHFVKTCFRPVAHVPTLLHRSIT